jgi:hypothetical protein
LVIVCLDASMIQNLKYFKRGIIYV